MTAIYIKSRSKKFKKNPNGYTFYFDKKSFSTSTAAVQALLSVIKPKYQSGSAELIKCHTQTHWGLRYEKVNG